LMEDTTYINNEDNIVDRRYDFCLLYDVTNGNPNGDPDGDNQPRTDPETGHGLVTDVCLKRKIRDTITMLTTNISQDGNVIVSPGYRIYIQAGNILNDIHEEAYSNIENTIDDNTKNNSKKTLEKTQKARAWMCSNFYDVRTFGAVLSTGDFNCGQVRGPVQLTFSESVDPITFDLHTITRKAITERSEAEKQINNHGSVTGTMGKKYTVPYALYRCHGFVSPIFAGDTGFTYKDLSIFWDALKIMFDLDHTSSRGEMVMKKIVVFEHTTKLGNANSYDLFQRVKVNKINEYEPARKITDYNIEIDTENIPVGVNIINLI